MKGLKDPKTGKFAKNIPLQKGCQICQISFSPRHEAQKFCGRDCFSKYASVLYSKKTIVACDSCNKPLGVTPGRAKKFKNVFCNSQCYGKWMADTGSHDGSKSFLWKGGITTANALVRGSYEMRQWRESVFKRDNYTCQHCGERGGKLHADHIKPFAYFPELRFVLDNGRTLCISCHKKTDTYLVNKKLV